jgi:lysophospholipase L1-like esterase
VKQLKRACIFSFVTIFILSSCTLGLGTRVNGEFHANKSVSNLTKKQIPHDFIPLNFSIVSVGDSLTKGVGDSSKRGGYIPYLQEKLEEEKGINEVEFSNFGVKGNKTKDLLNRLKTNELLKAIKESDMVIVTIGGNDIMKVVKENISHLEKKDFIPAKAQFEKNLLGIFDTIRKIHPDIPIVLVSLYNPFYAWFADVKEMDEILVEWNQTGQKVVGIYKGSYFVSIEEVFKKSNENLLFKDYFHPNDKGYMLIANRLHETFREKVIKDFTNRKYTVN